MLGFVYCCILLKDKQRYVQIPIISCMLLKRHTVEALLTDTLVSRQLYLRPPCLKPRFNSHTNSVFLHSPKRTFRELPRTLTGITT